jgi:hypothetical protein
VLPGGLLGYKLSQLRVVPVGADAALVTYFAYVKTSGDNVEHQMSVGEVWVKRNGQWLIRGYSGTVITQTARTAAAASMSRPPLT